MAFFNTSGISGAAGTLYGTNRVDPTVAFKGNPNFGTDYYDTNDNGRTGWARFSDVLGGDNKFKSYMANKYPQMWDQFGAASGDDPTMTWTKWLTQNQDQMLTDYSNLSPSERGEAPGRTLGKLRWL
jgi:hypothetical protein